MQKLAASLPPCSYVLVAARGSSDHAATYARYVLGNVARLPVAPAAPSLHTLYRTPPRLMGPLNRTGIVLPVQVSYDRGI